MLFRHILPARHRHGLAWLLGLAASVLPLWAAAQTTLSLQGILGDKALLMIGKDVPHAVAPGETYQGIQLLSASGDEAVVLADGQRITLRMGGVPASIGPGEARDSDRIALTADARGHFLADGSINGHKLRFLVDTGASMVGIGQADADQLGLDYKSGRRIKVTTANGVTLGWMFRIPMLRVGNVTSYSVAAVVTPAPMPVLLLGNSFLSRFSMQREGNQMVLIRR